MPDSGMNTCISRRYPASFVAGVIGLFLSCAAAYAAEKESTARVTDFDQSGMLVVKHTFFDVARPAADKEGEFKAPAEILADRLFVTNTGVYNFLESPANKKLVGEIPANTVLVARGKLYVAGQLLVLDKIIKAEANAKIDTAKFSAAKGEIVELNGTNACQCMLDLAGLPQGCELGHLHHLQAAGGVIYTYMPFGVGLDYHAGRGSHGRRIELKGLLLPGNNLLAQ